MCKLCVTGNLVKTRLQSFLFFPDFGLSGVLDGDRTLCTQCGSPAYTAPEIFAGQPYTSAVDVWSL